MASQGFGYDFSVKGSIGTCIDGRMAQVDGSWVWGWLLCENRLLSCTEVKVQVLCHLGNLAGKPLPCTLYSCEDRMLCHLDKFLKFDAR